MFIQSLWPLQVTLHHGSAWNGALYGETLQAGGPGLSSTEPPGAWEGIWMIWWFYWSSGYRVCVFNGLVLNLQETMDFPIKHAVNFPVQGTSEEALVDAYLARLQLCRCAPTLESLQSLLAAHVDRVPEALVELESRKLNLQQNIQLTHQV